MELSANLLHLQGIFLSLQKTHGELKKIKYKGGNEETVSNTVIAVQKFLLSNNYIKNKMINTAFCEELTKVVLFLILNTELNSPLDEPEYMHLIDVMPQLSKCLLAHIIVELNLMTIYTKILEENFSLPATEELLAEVAPILKKNKPILHITNAFTILKMIVTKLSSSTKQKVNNDSEKLSDLASYMLLNLTGLHGDQSQNIRVDSVYEQIGRIIFNLLDLLTLCDKNNVLLLNIIEKLLKTCSSIMMAVTLDVFCLWAEIDEDGQSLQTLVSTTAYLFIEKYQKYGPAKELISMLSTIAQKPKSISELIQKADVSKIISMIHKADSNQKHWFIALLNTQALQNEEAIKCISRWAHLTTTEDVSRLLNMSASSNPSDEAKKVVIKCASTLELSQLVLVTTRHFHQNGIKHILNDNIHQQIILLFNKIKNSSNAKEEFSKELYLLLLQNPEETLTYAFSECLKNKFYTQFLRADFSSIKECVNIENFGLLVLNRVIEENKPDVQNLQNYIELFNVFLEVEFYSMNSIVLKIILPLLDISLQHKNDVVLKNTLEILSSLKEVLEFKEGTEGFFTVLFNIIETYRCKFLEFEILKQEITKESVGIVMKTISNSSANPSHEGNVKSIVTDEENNFVSYYKQSLMKCDENLALFKHLCPGYNAENGSEVLAYLMKVLPMCVTQEWMKVSSELIDVCGVDKCVETLCDFLILICHLVKSQETKTENVNTMQNALKYCLQNFGIVIKESVQPKVRCLDQDVCLTKNICRLLKDVPNELKVYEGLSLANILSDESLKSLKTDKKFAWSVFQIREPLICKMLGQKMLS